MACSECKTDDPQRLYMSGKMPRCYDCQRYANLTKKSKGGFAVTREEFITWIRQFPSRCVYCGIDRNGLYAMGIINPRNKRRFESIGLDRLDNSQSYELSNLVMCCGPCNSIKSSILTHTEMLTLGEAVAALWSARILDP